MRGTRIAIALAVAATTLPWLLGVQAAPASADTADQVQACPAGATNDQFNCMRYPYPIEEQTAELMPDGTFSWVSGSDNRTLPTCPNFVQPADVPCQQFGPTQVRVFEGASSPTKVLPLVPGTGQVSLYGAGYSSQFSWAGSSCGTYECRYWVRPSSNAFADGQDRVLMMEYKTYIRATYDSSGITSTYRNTLVEIPRPMQDPFANATYSATGVQGEWRLDASTSTAVSPATITDWQWTIPGVGVKHGQVVNAVIPQAQLPAQVTLKVTDSNARSTTTDVTVDDSIAIQTVDVEPDSPVVGADPAIATVTLENQGAWPVTNATVALTSATPSLLTVGGGPTPAARTLAPGASGTFAIPLDAVARGQATIRTSASAKDGARTLTDGPKEGFVTVKAPAVQAVLEADAGARTSFKPFDVRAVVTNTGDTTLTDVRPDGALTATGTDDLEVTGPTPASAASLAPDASVTFTYRVTSAAGTVHLGFRAKATDPDAGPITGNTAQLDKQVVDGLRITSMTGERSGKAYATANGGETITLKGAGFTDVTQVVLDDGTDDSIVLDVAAVNDTTITIESPDVAARLKPLVDGSRRYLVDASVRYPDPDHPGADIVSAPISFSFQAPIISEVSGGKYGALGAGARGGDTLTLTGSGFTDVTTIAMVEQGTTDQVVTIHDIDVVDDSKVTITSPDVTALLEADEDGIPKLAVDVYAAYPNAGAPGGVVQSNGRPFTFFGPSISSITAERSGRAVGAIKGGETLTIHGFDLDDVTQVTFRRAGTDDDLISVDATVIDSETIEVTSPDVSASVTYAGDDQPGGVNTTAFAVVTPDTGVPYGSNGLPFDFQGPSISAVHGERGGNNAAPVSGDTITVEGTGLTDVTKIELFRTGTTELLTTIDVTEATETELTFASGNLAAYLLPQSDGLDRVKADLVAVVPAAQAPGGVVDSQSLRIDLTPPSIESIAGTRSGRAADTAKGGVNTITLTGRYLKDATKVVITRRGTDEVLEEVPVSSESDDQLTFDSPSMTKYLEPFEDGQARVETDIRLVYLPEDGPVLTVSSNPAAFDFLAPHLDAVTAHRGTPQRGPVSGGDSWVLTGSTFTDVTHVSLFRADTDELLVQVPVEPTDDTTIEVTSPAMERYLLPQSDGLDRVKIVIRATYEEDQLDARVRSNGIRYDLTPPTLDLATAASFRTDGTLDAEIEGLFFDDVTFAGYRDPGAPDQLVAVPFTVADDTHLSLAFPPLGRFMEQLPDGSWAADIDYFVGYRSAAAPDGAVLSNSQAVQLRSAALTRVSQASSAGDTEIEVASNDGWVPGQYALIEAPGGAIVRRVAGIGSLIFDAPVPVDLPVGTLIWQIDPPGDDTTAPTITGSDRTVPVGLAASVEFACADGGGVGVEACTGSVSSGTAIDTTKPGTTTVTVSAWDRNGNASTRVLTIEVVDGTTPTTPSTPTTTAPVPTTAPPSPATASTGSGTLARTGSSPTPAVQTALVLLAAGALLLLGSRRARGRDRLHHG